MISKRLLERAMDMVPISSDDAARYSMGGVLIVSDGKRVVLTATDGHRLIEREIPGECPQGRFMLYRDNVPALKVVLKEQFKGIEAIDCAIDMHGGLLIGSDIGSKARIPKYDLEYPDYKSVIPSFAQGQSVSIAFDAEYLLEMAKVFRDGEKRRNPMVRIEFNPSNPSSAIKVYATGGEIGGIGVLMPCRDPDAKRVAVEYSEAQSGGAV